MITQAVKGIVVAVLAAFVLGVYLFGATPDGVGEWVGGVFSAFGQFMSGMGSGADSEAVG